MCGEPWIRTLIALLDRDRAPGWAGHVITGEQVRERAEYLMCGETSDLRDNWGEVVSALMDAGYAITADEPEPGRYGPLCRACDRAARDVFEIGYVSNDAEDGRVECARCGRAEHMFESMMIYTW